MSCSFSGRPESAFVIPMLNEVTSEAPLRLHCSFEHQCGFSQYRSLTDAAPLALCAHGCRLVPWRGFQYAQTLGRIRQKTKLSELNTIQGGTPTSSALLSVYASTQDFGGNRLIPTPQISIQGLWLGANLAEAAPARLQAISSAHVHRMVRLRTFRVTFEGILARAGHPISALRCTRQTLH